MLPRAHRLTHSRAFQALYRRGRRWENALLVLHVLPRAAGDVRFGVVVGKKVGGAVARNRVRRLIREAVRRHLPEFRGGGHGVLVARPAAAGASFAAVERAVVELLERARVFRPDASAPGASASDAEGGGTRPARAEAGS